MTGEPKSCAACFWRPVPTARHRYCCNACRQRAYRERRRPPDSDVVFNAVAELLKPERIETYSPETRDFLRRVLKRALRSL